MTALTNKDPVRDRTRLLARFDADPERRIVNMREMVALVREDWQNNGRSLFRPGFQAMALHRFGVWREKIRPRLLRMPFSLLYRIGHVFVRNVYGIELHATAVIGRRLRIAHQHGIVIHPRAIIGDDCRIRQGVTIGIANVRPRSGRVSPMLGDRVRVGAGAVLLGPIRIGQDAMIGANVVVMSDVPEGAIVMPPVPRIIPRPRGVAGSELT